MTPFVTGFNHRTLPIALRETLSPDREEIQQLLPSLQARAGLEEVVVLSTCNRLEIYGVARGGAPRPGALFGQIGRTKGGMAPGDFAAIEAALYQHAGEDCVRHLFRVASGLDSMVIGETEILGQVKQAYQLAQSGGGTRKILNKLFQKSFFVAKQVRTRFGVGRWPTSVGSVAAGLAAQIFGEELARRTALIIGAGKMGETVLKHLAKQGIGSILVANRSAERAAELAVRFGGGGGVPLDALARTLPLVDVVISSTGAPHHILRRRDIAEVVGRRGGRPLFLIDLAVPRDIEPSAGELEGVYLFNLDQLSETAGRNLEKRQAETAPCEELIAAQAAEFAFWLAAQARAPRAAPGASTPPVLTAALAAS